MPRGPWLKPVEVTDRLQQLRVASGLTQAELAEAAGLTGAYISRLEAGQRIPSIDALIKLAGPLHTTALFLLTGSHRARCPCCGRKEPRAAGATNGRQAGR